MNLLHVVATPRGERSRTLAVATAFLEELSLHLPDLSVTTVDVTDGRLPQVTDSLASAKYPLMGGQAPDPADVPDWPAVAALAEEFCAADAYLVTSPMWNFGVPYWLKQYIDCVVQPGYAFRYEGGYPTPMLHGKQMVCISSRGADYSPEGPMGVFDFQEPYLRAIFGFIGITDTTFINAQPLDHPVLGGEALTAAIATAQGLARDPRWAGGAAA